MGYNFFPSKEACSWRSDSTRCYPGECKDELAANCKCSKGFTGRHCEISKLPDISVDIDFYCLKYLLTLLFDSCLHFIPDYLKIFAE